MLTDKLPFQVSVQADWGIQCISGLWRLSNPDPLAAGTIKINPAGKFPLLGEQSATGLQWHIASKTYEILRKRDKNRRLTYASIALQ